MADLIPIFTREGAAYSIPSENVEAALSQGARLASPEEIKHQKLVQEMGQDDGIIPTGQAAAGFGAAANALTLGAFDPLLKKFSPERYERLQAAKEAFPETATASSVTGTVATLPFMGGVNALGESAAAKVAPTAARYVGPRLAAATEKAVNLGTQGVAVMTPQATAELIAGNPVEAAESLVIGGLGGAALGGSASLLGDVLSAVKTPVVSGLKKGEEYIQGALENLEVGQNLKQAGFTKATIKSMKGGFERAKDLSDFIKEKDVFGILSNAPDEYQAVKALQSAAGKEIGGIFKSIDSSGKKFIDPIELLQKIKTNAPRPVGKLMSAETTAYDNSIEEVLKTMFPSRTIAKYGGVNNLLNAVEQGEIVPNFPRFQRLQAAKNLIGDYAYSDRGFPRPGRTIASVIERTLDNSIDESLEFAERSFPAKRAAWLEAKRNYRNYKALLEPLNNKIATELGNQLVRPSDLAMGIMGAAAGGGPGAAKAYLFNVMRHEFGAQITSKLLSGVNGAIQNRDKLIAKGVDAFYKGLDATPQNIKNIPARALPASAGALGRYISELFDEDEPDKQKAVEKLSQVITESTSNPAVSTNALSSATEGLDGVHPSLSSVVNQRITTALQYLSTQIPQNETPGTPFKATPVRFSDDQISGFERKLAAAMDPYSILEDLRQGTLHEDSVAAVKDMYPAFFNKLTESIMSKAVEKQRNLTFAQRSQLALILGDAIDPVLSPDFIQTLQGNYNRTPEEEQTGGNFRPKVKNMAENTQTQIERITGQ